MTLVTGTVQDLGHAPMDGTLYARPARFLPAGNVVYAPERTPYKIEGGEFSVELAPGPAVLELRVGTHARDEFRVVIPDQETITLSELIEEVFPWQPEQVSKFVAERELAVAAKNDAVTAAGDAETAAQQTGQDRQAVAQDRTAVEDTRALLDEAYDQSQAGMALPPRLMESALSATYATVVQVISDGTDQTAQINTALAAGVAYGDRKTVKLVGEFTITTTLIIPSRTTLDTRDATIKLGVGANCRMAQNAAAFGAGTRDTDVHIVGGLWDRGSVGGGPVAVAGGTSTDTTHSILMHRVDRCSVSDLRFLATGGVKFSIWLADATHALVERCDLTSTSDGVHVCGPSSHITIRDIIGTTDDDLISFTGRDYDGYEPTAGGGDLSDIRVERITLRHGDGNTVKLLPGAGRTMSRVVVRSISGNPVNAPVTIYSDNVFASTTGGSVRDVLIDGVSGSPTVNGFPVNVRHGDVEGLKVRNVHIENPDTARGVAFYVPEGGSARNVIIDGVTSASGFEGAAVHVGTGYTVRDMQLSNVSVQSGDGRGTVVQVSGTLDNLLGENINQTGGRAVVNIDGVGLCPVMAISGLSSTATYGLFINNAAAAVDVTMTGVTRLPTSRLVFVNAGAATLRGSGVIPAASHIGKSTGATIRATGSDLRADVSALTPQAGDVVYNTAGTNYTPVGPLVSNGDGSWTNLRTGAKVANTFGWDPPSIAAGGYADLTITASTAVVGDSVRLSPPATVEPGLVWSGWVSAANTITVRLFNLTGAAINQAQGTWRYAVSNG